MRSLWVLFFILSSASSFKIAGSSQRRLGSRSNVGSLKAGIDVSGLSFVPIPTEDLQAFNAVTEVASQTNSLNDIQNILIIAAGLGYFAYEKRPRGSSRDDLLDVRRSKVPGANLGVFAKKFVPKDTVIGYFPGYLRSVEEALSSKSSDKARESAKKYMWQLDEDQVLDPTNEAGVLEGELIYLSGLVKIDTTIARINEPPVGGDCNVFTGIEGGSGVKVITERDIFADEEIFIDYGRVYDRSDYEKQEKEAEKIASRAAAEKRREEEKMLTLQPVTTDSVQGKELRVDQDTSRSDGFLSKLAKQDEAKYKQLGIIGAEEGASLFADVGAGMFSSNSKEDRELLESLTGSSAAKQDSGSAAGGRSTTTASSSKNDFLDSFGRNTGASSSLSSDAQRKIENMEDDELLKSLQEQLGKSGLDNLDDIPDITTATATPPRGIFSPEVPPPTQRPSSKTEQQPAPAPAVPVKIPTATIDTAAASAKSVSAGSSGTLTKEEIQNLENSLDDMSDDEVMYAISKMQKMLQSKLPSVEPSKKLPRTPAIDPKIRAKYDRELSAIEGELEKIYNDPLGVWQELMANPEKFLDEDEVPGISEDKPLQ